MPCLQKMELQGVCLTDNTSGCLQKKVGYNAVVSAPGSYWGFTWGVSGASWGYKLVAKTTQDAGTQSPVKSLDKDR